MDGQQSETAVSVRLKFEGLRVQIVGECEVVEWGEDDMLVLHRAMANGQGLMLGLKVFPKGIEILRAPLKEPT